MILFLSICAVVMSRIPNSSTKDPQHWSQDRLWSWRCSRFRPIFSAHPARAPASKERWEWCLDHGMEMVFEPSPWEWRWYLVEHEEHGSVGVSSPALKQAEAKGCDVLSCLLYHSDAFCNLSPLSKPSCCPWCSNSQGNLHSPHSCSAAQVPTKPPAELSCIRGTLVPLLHGLSSLLQSH